MSRDWISLSSVGIYLELMSGWMLPRIGRDGYTQGCDDMLIDSLDCCYLVPTHELHIE